MPKTRTSWEPGRSGNPNGRPRKPEVEELRKAIKAVKKHHDLTLFQHFVEKAYTDNHVLIALMKKLIPDMKSVESEVNLAGENLGVIRLPAKKPEGAPVDLENNGT